LSNLTEREVRQEKNHQVLRLVGSSHYKKPDKKRKQCLRLVGSSHYKKPDKKRKQWFFDLANPLITKSLTRRENSVFDLSDPLITKSLTRRENSVFDLANPLITKSLTRRENSVFDLSDPLITKSLTRRENSGSSTWRTLSSQKVLAVRAPKRLRSGLTRRSSILLCFTLALEERAEAVGASFADKELDYCSRNQAEPCKQDEIRGLDEQPVLGIDNQEHQRHCHPCLVPEGIGSFRPAGEKTGKFSRDDMAALLPGGTFRAEREDDDKA
jgi:hypothetical protein